MPIKSLRRTFLIAFFVVFNVLGFLMIHHDHVMKAIARAPVFTVAFYDRTISSTEDPQYRLVYTYVVDGAIYTIETGRLGKGWTRLEKGSPALIAYAAAAPADAVFKDDLDNWSPDDPPAAIIGVSVLSAIVVGALAAAIHASYWSRVHHGRWETEWSTEQVYEWTIFTSGREDHAREE